MGFLLLADGELATALELCKQYGPLFVAVIFFLWRDWKREDRLSKRINTLEDEQRHVILPLVKDCTSVITKNTTAMERLEKMLEHHHPR
jgi:hypothetical protein